MPRPPNTKTIHYHLPDDHPALATLDAYCTEWDKSRADATKDIVSAWAKARQGNLSALSGLLSTTLGAGGPVQTVSAGLPPEGELQTEKGPKLRRSPSRNAQSVDLDL